MFARWQEMQNYITSSAADGKGNTVLGVKEGEISVIFSKKVRGRVRKGRWTG